MGIEYEANVATARHTYYCVERWLFARQETVEAAWKIVDQVLGDVVPVHPYSKGSWGPAEADRLAPVARGAHHD